MNTETPAFEIVDSSASIETPGVLGLHYTNGLNGVDVAREFRDAFKRAQKFGAFRGVKVSVKSSRFSGGTSVDIKITAAPFAVNDPRKLDENVRRGSPRVATSARMQLLIAQLTMLANLWRRDESDSSRDYFNCNCYLDVSVSCDDAEEHRLSRARVAAQDLRAVVAAVDELMPITDDAAEFAVSMAERGETDDALVTLRDAVKVADGHTRHVIAAVEASIAAAMREPWAWGHPATAARPGIVRALAELGRGAEFADSILRRAGIVA